MKYKTAISMATVAITMSVTALVLALFT